MVQEGWGRLGRWWRPRPGCRERVEWKVLCASVPQAHPDPEWALPVFTW